MKKLSTRYDQRLSFYGKAKFYDTNINGHKGYMLKSYDTDVAFAYTEYEGIGIKRHVIDPDTLTEIDENKPGWSMTTNRHIREFCKQYKTHGELEEA